MHLTIDETNHTFSGPEIFGHNITTGDVIKPKCMNPFAPNNKQHIVLNCLNIRNSRDEVTVGDISIVKEMDGGECSCKLSQNDILEKHYLLETKVKLNVFCKYMLKYLISF